MLTESQIEEVAQQLLEADEARRQIERITAAHPSMTMEEGYAIQKVFIRKRQGGSRVVVGKKVALTNKAVQQVLGVDSPVFGH
ncbi:MAG TPA: hypothetical protein VFD42_04975, partial [Chloroflexota bacterium]|nr:hypothetical protein [Chloroflexota bacterium]